MLNTVHNDDNCDFIRVHSLSNEAINVLADSCKGGFQHFFILTVHTDTNCEFDASLLFFEQRNEIVFVIGLKVFVGVLGDVIIWDGVDNSGSVNVLTHVASFLFSNHESLGESVIIFGVVGRVNRLGPENDLKRSEESLVEEVLRSEDAEDFLFNLGLSVHGWEIRISFIGQN
jgi:hypothetical protein